CRQAPVAPIPQRTRPAFAWPPERGTDIPHSTTGTTPYWRARARANALRLVVRRRYARLGRSKRRRSPQNATHDAEREPPTTVGAVSVRLASRIARRCGHFETTGPRLMDERRASMCRPGGSGTDVPALGRRRHYWHAVITGPPTLRSASPR